MAAASEKTSVLKGVIKGVQKTSLILLIVYAVAWWINHKIPYADYRDLPYISNRVAIWIIAQLHLMLAAFVLGVPIFAVIVEIVGAITKDSRYDRLAKEFTKLLFLAFTSTAIFGAFLLLGLIYFYPKFFHYMSGIFSPTWTLYICLIFGEVIFAYLYWYSWEPLNSKKPLAKPVRFLLNIVRSLVCSVLTAGLLLLVYASLVALLHLFDIQSKTLQYGILVALGIGALAVLGWFLIYWSAT